MFTHYGYQTMALLFIKPGPISKKDIHWFWLDISPKLWSSQQKLSFSVTVSFNLPRTTMWFADGLLGINSYQLSVLQKYIYIYISNQIHILERQCHHYAWWYNNLIIEIYSNFNSWCFKWSVHSNVPKLEIWINTCKIWIFHEHVKSILNSFTFH